MDKLGGKMQKQIPQEFVESIRSSNDIVDVIGEYVQLKKQGKNYFGLCPFHGEKTPSFSVTHEKQIFHCFGCGKGGNVITFLKEIENISFQEAVRTLADRSGVKLPKTLTSNTVYSESSDQLFEAYRWLSKLYHHLLKYTKDGKTAIQYLKDRGIVEESINTFQLGFAPITDEFTAKFLEKKGFDRSFLVKSGLLSLRDDHTAFDRFRGRVIFPIRNHLGKPIAFGGRSITDQEPKYLNSPENDLFHKSKILFNFDLAKKHIRKKREAILFEGYIDVISAYQANIKNVIATLGTSMSMHQARLIKRYVDKVIICYDADQAGINATYQTAKLLLDTGCEVYVANLNEGMDPDGFIRKYGGRAFEEEVVKSSDMFIKFYMNNLRKEFNLQHEGERLNYIEKVLKEIATIGNAIEREYYLKELSSEFNISYETLNDELKKYKEQHQHKDKRDENSYTNRAVNYVSTKRILPAFHNAERHLIAYMLQDVHVTNKVQKELGASFNVEEHKIIVTHLYAFFEENEQPNVSLFMDYVIDDQLKELISDLAMISLDDFDETVVNDYIHIIKAEQERSQILRDLKNQQKQFEEQNEPIKAAEIAMQILNKEKQLNTLK